MSSHQYETYLAPTSDGNDVILGRGDVGDPSSGVNYAFASVPTPDGALHEGIVRHLDEAAGGGPITRANGAAVLSKAIELAKRDPEAPRR